MESKLSRGWLEINQTGTLDDETLVWMNYPRCGVADVSGTSDPNVARKKRYALQGSKWSGHEISYYVTKYTLDLTTEKVDREMAKAFKVWADITPLSFVTSRVKPDIEIRFESWNHKDGEAFDGPGRTLAHAFFPKYGGDMHFDDDETWTVESYRGTNLFQVASHELATRWDCRILMKGTNATCSVLSWLRGNNYTHRDDVEAIQILYGTASSRSGADKDKKKSSAAPSATTSSPHPTLTPGKPDICLSPRIDAITTTLDDSTYVFKGDWYWKLNDDSFEPGYPKRIADDWDGLPGDLDAALTSKNFDSKTFFFKGNKYWKFVNQEMMPGYPKIISVGFPGIPADISAAFAWGGNGKAYFIKDDQYYRYSHNSLDAGYPKHMSVWVGLPTRIDATFVWKNGKSYFFRGSQYYKFNDGEFEVEDGYPRSTGKWWFGCSSEDLQDTSPSADTNHNTWENVTVPLNGHARSDSPGKRDGADTDANRNAATSLTCPGVISLAALAAYQLLAML
ncbi:PREDICTED: LOW QUALITY PROTEIN: matrix metalloproteinase-16-like [Priapulus caudatus]|uniref:LOW QUALITY PROTEIN: matrix metalloproteinase-16-like n=1 Tax=Priapulus caudatus TaxID=37621 RepID=A0ABM1EK98_PRICU|nr:PREDICTED: LOW QUALITY PROTEIN: matrix metalloproteinase-16-like [Priapulus caudatus]